MKIFEIKIKLNKLKNSKDGKLDKQKIELITKQNYHVQKRRIFVFAK